MSRHVVLLRRDPSLGLALRALLHGTGRVTELLTIQGWSALPADTVDAVVIDLPTPRRTQAIDLIRSHFDGRLVLVLDPSDDPAAVPSHHDCSILQRPFEIVELWHLVTTDPAPARSANGERGTAGDGVDTAPGSGAAPPVAGESAGPPAQPVMPPAPPVTPPAPPVASPGPTTTAPPNPPAAGGPESTRPAAATSRERDSAGSTPRERGAGSTPSAQQHSTSPVGERDPGSTGPGRTPAGSATADEDGPPDVDASTWRWRGRRYGPATAIPPDPPGGGPGPGARPGARTGESTRTAGPSATAPAAGTPPGRATQDQPSGTQGDEPRSEGRHWGALPRRSADPQSGDQPGQGPETPR